MGGQNSSAIEGSVLALNSVRCKQTGHVYMMLTRMRSRDVQGGETHRVISLSSWLLYPEQMGIVWPVNENAYWTKYGHDVENINNAKGFTTQFTKAINHVYFFATRKICHQHMILSSCENNRQHISNDIAWKWVWKWLFAMVYIKGSFIVNISTSDS